MFKCLIFSNLVVANTAKIMKDISQALDQYTGICKEALHDCGLTHSQARDVNKLDCAFNASFASLNVAKVMMKERGMEYSMSKFKLLMTNTFMAKRIFDVSRFRPNQTLITQIFNELFGGAA